MESQLVLGGSHVTDDKQFDIRSISSSGKFNLYDSWNLMNCGALVLFRNQIPFQIDLRDASRDDLEWELNDLGFDGARIDEYGNYVCFTKEIDDQLKRVGLHTSCGFGHSITFDYSDENSSIYLYDHYFKVEMSPIKAIRALRSLKGHLPHSSFWSFITGFTPIDWVAIFMGYEVDGEVCESDSCTLDMEDVRFILKAYNSLTEFSKKCFDKWCEGDYLAMLELAKRITC